MFLRRVAGRSSRFVFNFRTIAQSPHFDFGAFPVVIGFNPEHLVLVVGHEGRVVVGNGFSISGDASSLVSGNRITPASLDQRFRGGLFGSTSASFVTFTKVFHCFLRRGFSSRDSLFFGASNSSIKSNDSTVKSSCLAGFFEELLRSEERFRDASLAREEALGL
ncbi:hypothetical protein PUN28_017580 [Cardiocondyla obscurior]|uniref:Uncharacterized protein n=1 Tax=Cardiocondyla obscurior TaxID=286306 RepID=A0AAW2EI57_9HYME